METTPQETTAVKKKSHWLEKTLTVIGILVILFCVFLAYGTGINNRFYKLMVVTSGSMVPVFYPGDLICIVRMDPNKAKVGDIVIFKTDEGVLTHRIVAIKADGEIVTKGDANSVNDSWPNGWKLGQVETKYVFTIPKLGYLVSWIQGVSNSTGAWLKDKITSKGNTITADVPTPAPMAKIETPTSSPDLTTVTPEPTVIPEVIPSTEVTATPDLATATPNATTTVESTASSEETASPEATATPEETQKNDSQ
jgi:signal peptidase I